MKQALDFNPRSPWGERPFVGISMRSNRVISIHAPRGWSDYKMVIPAFGTFISIHAPRGGSDPHAVQPLQRQGHFNPRSPWGERRKMGMFDKFPYNFNPRSPWGERLARGNSSVEAWGFQYTLPVGGATRVPIHLAVQGGISIHAPRGGSDPSAGCLLCFPYISIHAPRGGSDSTNRSLCQYKFEFQSTLPVGGATFCCVRFSGKVLISIHAPRGGSDGKDAQISGSIFGKDIKFVRHNPGKVVPNRFKNR